VEIISTETRPSLTNHPAVDQAMPKLGPALLRRFESDEGYRNFPDTIPCRLYFDNPHPHVSRSSAEQ